MTREEHQQRARVEALAAQIVDNHQLRRLLRSTKPEMRREVFELIKPFLVFEPKPYLLLK